ncbi:hypothetical protein HAX54_002073 [Datura stramonium]|uniref:RNase H type-1 domain-containing protein n=1 Tax=Datura stramonium TaxID=4076 RepID=A0ABS8T3C8_DATST|nr:hypothetical protein [Datura stramonium]
MSAYGFCLRNNKGDLDYTEAHEIGFSSNMKSEVQAIWHALKYSINLGHNIILETDSLSLQKVLTREWKVPSVIAGMWTIDDLDLEAGESMVGERRHVRTGANRQNLFSRGLLG